MDPRALTDEYLDTMRRQADPAADAVVDLIYAEHQLDGVNRVLMHLVRNTGGLDPALVKKVDDYFAGTAVLPPWADRRKIELAEHLFTRNGLLSTTILCCASLPECYLDARDVPVLAATTQLAAHTYRRIFETSHMVITVMQPGGIVPPGGGVGEGVRCCQKVRLMHAAIRHLIAQRNAAGQPGELGHQLTRQAWDTAADGAAINQESMAYVILTFSYVGVRGLRTLGAQLSDAEAEAYVHAWSVIGHLMGVDDSLLAHSVDEARQLFEKIKSRRRGASEPGRKLTKALVDFMAAALPRTLRWAPAALVTTLLGDDDAALLGVRLSLWQRLQRWLAMWLLRHLLHLGNDAMATAAERHFAEAVFRGIVQGVWDMKKGWNRETFALPPSLTEAWQVRQQPALRPLQHLAPQGGG